MQELLKIRTRVRENIISSIQPMGVFEGTPSREAYIHYLKNVYGYAQHSPKVIALAASRCMNSHPEIAKYLLIHAEEERGHHLWALADLKDLGVEGDDVKSSYPVPACTSMIGMMYYIAGHANPVGLFGWLYVLEAMGDDLGAVVTQRYDEGLKLKGKALRFLKGHGENDVEHTKDLTEVIARHIVLRQDISDVNHVAEVIGDLYVRLFKEIADGVVARG